jgi:26S proteasome regulatory subunit N1
MTYSDTRPRETLRYRLLSNEMSREPSDPGLWGHEYIRHLSAELGAEFLIRQEAEASSTEASPFPASGAGSIEELRELSFICAKFLLQHNGEADAVDLLEELECVDKIKDLVDDNTYARVCMYMVRWVSRCVPRYLDFGLTVQRCFLAAFRFYHPLTMCSSSELLMESTQNSRNILKPSPLRSE